MKKFCSIFFLLIANTLLLAHAVVPHHHHGPLACFVASHCHEGEHADDDCCNGHQHQGSDSVCKLLQEFVSSKDNVLQHISDGACHHDCPFHDIVLFDITTIEEPAELSLFIDFCPPPSLHSIVVSGACGLRAPPVC